MYIAPRSGLSQGVPADVAANLDRLKTLIQAGLAKAEAAGRSDLVDAGKAYWREYLGTQYITVPAGLFDKARQEIVALLNGVLPWSQTVNLLTVAGAAALEEAERGSSFTEQLKQSFAPLTEAAGAVSDLGIPVWALAAGAGLVLFLLLRR